MKNVWEKGKKDVKPGRLERWTAGGQQCWEEEHLQVMSEKGWRKADWEEEKRGRRLSCSRSPSPPSPEVRLRNHEIDFWPRWLVPDTFAKC